MKEIKVNFGQSGYAAGKIVCLGRDAYERDRKEYVPSSELGRFMAAVDQMTQILGNALDDANEENSKVIEAELMLLNDMEFCGAIYSSIEKGEASAVEAVRNIGQHNTELLLAGADPYVSERVQDIKGITNGLIDILNGRQDGEAEVLTEPAIVVAEEMTTYDMACLPQNNILGIISQNGSRLCHVSIMAGNLGIPYVYGTDINIEEIAGYSHAILSGESASIILCNEDEILECQQAAMETSKENDGCDAEYSGDYDRELHTDTKIYLNISGCENPQKLSEAKADGVGLLRSEFMFLSNEYPPTEQEQYEAYVRILEAMGDKPVIIRLLDIGGDKPVPWVEDKSEPNPAMGLKGIRMLLERRDILYTQLRALLRASTHGKLKIMFPMIATTQEMAIIREIVGEIAAELQSEGININMPPIGVQIEVPAAALISDIIAEQSDFLSIGTNDLTQYTLAVDRKNALLDEYFDMGTEAVLRLIRMTVKAAHDKGIKVSVCGEMASDPRLIPKLVEAGTDALSVSLEKVEKTRIVTYEAERDLHA